MPQQIQRCSPTYTNCLLLQLRESVFLRHDDHEPRNTDLDEHLNCFNIL